MVTRSWPINRIVEASGTSFELGLFSYKLVVCNDLAYDGTGIAIKPNAMPSRATMDQNTKLREINDLRARAQVLEAEMRSSAIPNNYQPPYYVTYHVVNGCIFGAFGAAMSLLFNIVGSLFTHQHPLQLIRVYLTFPMGEAALAVQDDITLAIGCCMYLATGMFLGIPFQLVLSKWYDDEPIWKKFAATSALSLLLWLVIYYGILVWLQPLLFNGRWIVDTVPWWVAASTHLVFGWTILIASPMGRFTKYHRTSETA